MGELRGHRCIDGDTTNTTFVHVAKNTLQTIDVHRLGEHVFHHLIDQRMVGNLNVAHDVFLAGSYVRENRCQQIIRTHALNLRRNLLAALKAQQRQRAVRIPTPTRAEDWRRERRLLEHRLHSLGSEKMKHIGERKAVLLGEGDV